MKDIAAPVDPDLLVGFSGSDDAGVYRIGDACALVQTTDIITPLVDDPFTFGRIAAANAISDVYAMGGRPLTAMNLLFAPSCLPAPVLRELLRGGEHALEEAGACLVGGHTVEDDQLKYGMAVTGLIDPARIVRNNTPLPGDRLILTKPVGSGIIATAIKGESASEFAINDAISWMTLLNRRGAELMLRCGVNAATDVTGFGLIGHACEMAGRGEVSLALRLDDIPLMRDVMALISEGMVPAGCYRNRDYFMQKVTTEGRPARSADALLPLFDPQTSGGLLLALPPAGAEKFLELSAAEGVFAITIGEVVPPRESSIVII
jgi:selenide,water dikinase